MPATAAARPSSLPARADAVLHALAVAALYFAAAKIGFTAALVAEQVSPVWPPTGLALWAGLTFGRRIWPGVWLGAFLANTTTNVPVAAAGLIATGNLLEAIVGVWVLRRVAGVDRTLDSLRHVTTLLVGAAVFSTAISATIGVVTLGLFELQPWSRFTSLWWIWWLGDASGDILVAPVLLTLPLWKRVPRRAWRAVEAGVLALLTIGLSLVVFAVPIAPLGTYHPLEFVVFPLVIWAGLRFAHPGAALVSAVISTIAVWGTLHGDGPFSVTAGSSPQESVILLQIYTAVIATSGLAFGAAIADRNRADRLRITDHAITAILAEESDLSSASRRILRAVGETLEWDVGLIWRTRDGAAALEAFDDWHRDAEAAAFAADSRSLQFASGIGLPGRVWATGQPAWIDDVMTDANFPRAAAAARAGLHGAFAFPIRLGSRVLGVVEFFTRERRAADASLLTLMAAAGTQIGQFIDRRDAGQRLAESEALGSAIVNTALDCVISIDAAGAVIEFNPAATRVFGYTREQALGQELAALIVPARLRERHRAALSRVVETGESRILGTRVEMSALRADGTEFPIEVSISRVSIAGRAAFTAYLRDIAERKRTDDERAELLAREQAARQQAESANRAKDQFLSTVSHELRTPLTAILGWASMLRDGQVDPDRLPQIYDSIYRNADVQARIVHDLLDVSRMVTGQLRLDLKPVDVGDVARLSLETIRPAAIAKRVALEMDLGASPAMVAGDPARLQQVIWNLLSNGVKFTPAGGRVTLSVRDAGRHVVVEVADSGMGMDAAMLPHVFERFWQADSNTTRVHGGLGLGLAIVRHLVELHGGDVRAASEGPGRGSTFAVLLPALAGAALPDDETEVQARDLAADLSGLAALVVEDDASTRELFVSVLEKAGARVVAAASAAEAFDLVTRQRRQVLLLDIGLPGENGLMLLQRIRAWEAAAGRPATPAIAVSAYAAVIDRTQALAAGFAAHVAKPVRPQALVGAVAQVVASSRPEPIAPDGP